MKKLKLNFQQFSQVETLSRAHMRNVLGGNSLAAGDTSSRATCQFDWDCGDDETCKPDKDTPKFSYCS